jgi:beta-xylosidase
MTKYKFLCKKIINGKKRNIYLSDKTKKQYLKYKNKFMQVSKYKKIKNAKIAKKTKMKGGFSQTDTAVAASVCQNFDGIGLNADLVKQIQIDAGKLKVENCGSQVGSDGDCALANTLLDKLKQVGGRKRKKKN